MRRPPFLGLLPVLLLIATGICSAASPNFSGTWKQNNERCTPKRTGVVTLRIDHHDPDLLVETTVLRGSGPPRHAEQHYRTDGTALVSIGADGDEFHTSIHWSGASLVFAVEEHEAERILLSTETWTLIDDGAALQRVRERSGSGEQQTFIYSK